MQIVLIVTYVGQMDMWWILGQRGCLGDCCSISPDRPLLTCWENKLKNSMRMTAALYFCRYCFNNYMVSIVKSRYLSGTVLWDDGLLKNKQPKHWNDQHHLTISINYIKMTLSVNIWCDTLIHFRSNSSH